MLQQSSAAAHQSAAATKSLAVALPQPLEQALTLVTPVSAHGTVGLVVV